MTCDRCARETLSHIVSKFNTDALCLDCHDDEQHAPNYARASEAEEAACRRGDYNYPGISLAAEDRAFLQERRDARRQK